MQIVFEAPAEVQVIGVRSPEVEIVAEVRGGGGGAGTAAAQEDRRLNTDESRAEEACRKVLPLLQRIPGADLRSLRRCSTRLRELVTDAIRRGWQRCAKFNARPVIVTVGSTEVRADWVPDSIADHPIAQVTFHILIYLFL